MFKYAVLPVLFGEPTGTECVS